ncbi:hypothetical protein LXL04_034810 [Taraxacum kok-saghyz]
MKPSNSTIVFLAYCFLLVGIVAGKRSALDTSAGDAETIAHHYQTVKLSSFLSSSICSPSSKRDKKSISFEVVHKLGPCSKFSKKKLKAITLEEILTRDQSRVDTIRSRLTTTSTTRKKVINFKSSKATMPVKSGTTYDSGNYIVNVEIGTPKKNEQLILDSGSDLTWTQCQPCTGSCYTQQEPIFNPSLSTTYSNIPCTSTACSMIPSATGNLPGCSSSTCVYGVQYGDGSYSVGKLAKDKLTLTNNETLDNFYFGCGVTNKGDYGTASGLLGLGNGKLSIVTQAAKRYGKVFSYCLPSTDSASGHLTFGTSSTARKVQYTRLLSSQEGDTFYTVRLDSITVSGKSIQMSPSNVILDTGTVITRLPLQAYSVLSKAFRAQMMQYPLTKRVSILDTCYDMSNHTNVKIPKLTMVFSKDVGVVIPPQGILIAASHTQVCFAFAGNENPSDPSIYGNVQQMTTEMVFDMNVGKVGFFRGGCD